MTVHRRLGAFVGLLVVLCSLALTGAPATAAGEGSIDHVQAEPGALKILYSVPGLANGVQPDLDTLQVTVDDKPVEASAELAGDSSQGVRRTAILAIDVSNSMRGERFAQAKLAAKAFLDATPSDVLVGIVSFAGTVSVVQEPTSNRAAAVKVIDDLTLSLQTRLYDGVSLAVRSSGTEGQRGVLVLSDGRDTSSARLGVLLDQIKSAKVKVDVVSLEQSAGSVGPLEQIAGANGGAVLQADDPKALSEVFAKEADALAKQVLITAKLPKAHSGTEASLAVSVDADGATYSDSAFVSVLGETAKEPPVVDSGPQAVAAPAFEISPRLMLIGLGSAGLGVLVVLVIAFGGGGVKDASLEDRIAAYTATGDARAAAPTPGARRATPTPQGVTGQAVDVAARALARSKSLEANLAARLDGAGMSLKPAEWLLLHVGIAVGAGLVALLLSSGGILLPAVFLALGAFLPWIYLGMKRSRRLKAFDAQLADLLQLMSGSLSAGLSLAQSVDTVVREGTEPVAGELRRALMETRLGVGIEDTLDSVADRMESADFHWVVMAIRIQREVGGNLAELLLNVAGTLREREYLRRQVKSLSAEGRLSALILGALPPVFIGYLALASPEYLKPLFTNTIGWLMIGAVGVLMVVGVLWLKKMVKVEV